MSAIVCIINLFDMEQEIYQVSEDKHFLIAKAPLNQLHKVLPQLCYDKNIYCLRLFGYKEVAQDLKNKVINEENSKYSSHRIDIEVNG